MNLREELNKILNDLKDEGFKCYITPDNERNRISDYLWGYIITPTENILYIQRNEFPWEGWNLTLKYKPSRKTGSGCRCNVEPYKQINKDTVLKAEKEGILFARTLKATLYKSLDEALNGKGIEDWTKNFSEMIEI